MAMGGDMAQRWAITVQAKWALCTLVGFFVSLLLLYFLTLRALCFAPAEAACAHGAACSQLMGLDSFPSALTFLPFTPSPLTLTPSLLWVHECTHMNTHTPHTSAQTQGQRAHTHTHTHARTHTHTHRGSAHAQRRMAYRRLVGRGVERDAAAAHQDMQVWAAWKRGNGEDIHGQGMVWAA